MVVAVLENTVAVLEVSGDAVVVVHMLEDALV